jgi:hypothetical protein
MGEKKEEEKTPIDAVIRYWKSQLTHFRWVMDSGTQTVIERTIELLERVE